MIGFFVMKELKEHINWRNNDAINVAYILHHGVMVITARQLHSANTT